MFQEFSLAQRNVLKTLVLYRSSTQYAYKICPMTVC
jgi:hypothetical protein